MLLNLLSHCSNQIIVALILSLAILSSPVLNAEPLPPPQTPVSKDNLLAYRLYRNGDYARAAEIFTDPAWKGVALYQSSQWWRAAEAFIRANDALSAYNLGNCYVKLGYYELALDTYQRALDLDNTLSDAAHNAEIMRRLIASDQQDGKNSGQQPESEAIEQIASDKEPEQSGSGQEGEQGNTQEPPGAGDSQSQGDQQRQSSDDNAQAGDGADERQRQNDNEQSGEGSSAISGIPLQEQPPQARPSGGAEHTQASDEVQAAGIRSALNTEQATTQWLNLIEHDTQRFLQKRIALEARRREAAGQSPPAGGSSW